MKGIVRRSLAPAGIQTQATTAAAVFGQSQAPCPLESGVPAADVNQTDDFNTDQSDSSGQKH